MCCHCKQHESWACTQTAVQYACRWQLLLLPQPSHVLVMVPSGVPACTADEGPRPAHQHGAGNSHTAPAPCAGLSTAPPTSLSPHMPAGLCVLMSSTASQSTQHTFRCLPCSPQPPQKRMPRQPVHCPQKVLPPRADMQLLWACCHHGHPATMMYSSSTC
jgi:hypothetical protein